MIVIILTSGWVVISVLLYYRNVTRDLGISRQNYFEICIHEKIRKSAIPFIKHLTPIQRRLINQSYYFMKTIIPLRHMKTTKIEKKWFIVLLNVSTRKRNKWLSSWYLMQTQFTLRGWSLSGADVALAWQAALKQSNLDWPRKRLDVCFPFSSVSETM